MRKTESYRRLNTRIWNIVKKAHNNKNLTNQCTLTMITKKMYKIGQISILMKKLENSCKKSKTERN